MVSSKGKPTDPKLREEVKEKVQNQPNKDGSGKGQWSAWKATKLSKEYEAEGGGYENAAGSKNEPKKGAPKAKSEEKKKDETKGEKDEGEQSKMKSKTTGGGGKKRAEPKEPRDGTRKSERTKRKAGEDEEDDKSKSKGKSTAAKKRKTKA